MKFEAKTVRKAINKAFLKEPVERGAFDQFKEALGKLLNGIEQANEAEEREEHFKNLLPPFFKAVGFEDYKINTSSNVDLAIYTGGKTKDPLGVMMEVKRPSNKSEMISGDRLNRKAMHEAVLYYLEQRMDENNSDLKHVILTDMTHWYIFDAQEFERCFYRPNTLRKAYKEWKENRKVSSNTDFMYNEIASFINDSDASICGISLPLEPVRKLLKGDRGSEYEKRLIALYKFFSPIHLLKEPFANDSNSLNKEFYRELLYILGLEETKEGSTRYIRRTEEKNRQSGSLIENTIRILDAEEHLSTLKQARSNYGANREEQLFSVAMELGITWMNRILFLKLLEAQLFRYHRKDNHFKFLNYETIDSLDELNKLFFQVLARKKKDRSDDVNEKFGHIPYLNSSLFDFSDLEHQTTRISGLDDHAEMPVYSKSVLSNERGNTLNTLEYLFQFLEAYDFSAEGSEEIRDESKSLINASVLGLIFEKINGYKDGSFYTPGFITEYMARETLRKAVIDKFSAALTPGPSPASGRGEQDSDRVEEPGWKLPDELIENARHLRKNQTDAEEYLWQLLRNRQFYGYKFRRQHPIKPGFILDFYCAKEKLAVELDGPIHDRKDQKLSDEERTQILNDKGIQVIRFKNEVVLNDSEQVLQSLAGALGVYSAPVPSPAGGRGVPVGRGEGGLGEGELTFTDIYNRIGREISIQEANEIINSITICDPAVGSGHFLVSCLNELIAIKSELGILCDDEGKILRDVKVEVENDELIITHGEDLFEYDVKHTWIGKRLKERKVDPEKNRIQKTLFHEKRHLIENCLFGVDINPNSVKICRLRLWIELLKRAYYTALSPTPLPPAGEGRRGEGGELHVLPNIDINIKQGNSLVSRFELDSDLSSVFKDSDHSLDDYKEAVRNYKHTGDRNEKARLQTLIDDIKSEYTTTLTNIRPINKKISKARGRLEIMQSDDLFGEVKFTKKQITEQEKKLKKLEEQKAEEESGAFYNQAFEWRFEFPEVLDGEGRFTGFDVVIGNPPYSSKASKETKEIAKKYSLIQYKCDPYSIFMELSLRISNSENLICLITPLSYHTNYYYNKIREYLVKNRLIQKLIVFDGLVFEEANIDTSIIILGNNNSQFSWGKTTPSEINNTELISRDFSTIEKEPRFELTEFISKEWEKLREKVEVDTVKLGDFRKVSLGMKLKSNDEYVNSNQNDENPDPIIFGKDIDFYGNLNPVRFFNYSKAKIVGGTKNEEVHKYKPKILIQAIRNLSLKRRIVATIDTDGFYFVGTVNGLTPIENNELNIEDENYLLGIINSTLMNYYFTNRFTTISLTAAFLGELPIKKAKAEDQKLIAKTVQMLLEKKKQNPEADTTELESEIDRLVYDSYGLSEEEIGVVEGNN